MSELRDFTSKTDAEAFLDELERAGIRAVFVMHLDFMGRWVVEYERPAGPSVSLPPCPTEPDPCHYAS